ncbi:hypothetical protein [Natronoflexus pectinivorans]|nr:hypothetical protein [Natronoflexus pectinivorans]
MKRSGIPQSGTGDRKLELWLGSFGLIVYGFFAKWSSERRDVVVR